MIEELLLIWILPTLVTLLIFLEGKRILGRTPIQLTTDEWFWISIASILYPIGVVVIIFHILRILLCSLTSFKSVDLLDLLLNEHKVLRRRDL